VLDINDVIANMTKLMRRAVGENLTISTELDRTTGSVFADPGQLEQVLLNLAINARDAMAGPGSLVISTSEVIFDEVAARRYVDLVAGRYVRIEVIDTGSGMPRDVIEKAFDPFFTTKPTGQGTGLGLATVYGIVRRAGGHIAIRSREGLGTTFTNHLPVTADSVESVAQGSEPEVPRGDGERILLVEDEGPVRAVAKRLLTEGGYEVVEAASGDAALKLMNQEIGRIDILVSDVAMPGMSGIELGHMLQSMYPRLPAVYLTGYSEAAAYASQLGEKSVLLHKPFDRADLLTAIHDLLHPDKVGLPTT
jgi:CheY-like chemotaxis protein